ncbi:hypothetical protein POM88_027149 [Heracleum sosnowskyi]|uniref:Uncharacterized protein n=1 Tax=Heracleum sosnowskyi TaxID=360622 RepID=A0AAD8I804_9APIA|nr:hypothetical protein POM88_027149 [Heracleum sosnowskyi]
MDQSNKTENQPNETQKKGKVYWRGEFLTKTFLEACIEEVTANVTNSFNFTEEEWDQLCKRNKYVETLKSTPLSYPELCTHLYDGIAATGVSGWGPSSKRSRTFDTSDEKEIPDIEEIQSNASTAPNSQNSFNLDVEETPKKKN